MSLRIMTFNIHHGVGTDQRLNLERIARIIEHSRADVVGLNEVDRRFHRRSAFQDQLLWLSERLGMHAAFAPTLRKKSTGSLRFGAYGNGLLSRFPLENVRRLPLLRYPPGIEPRVLLSAVLEVGGDSWQIHVTHLSYLRPWQTKEQKKIKQRFAEGDLKRCVVMGDFNFTPNDSRYRDWGSLFQEPGEIGNTYPSGNPKKKIDHIWVSKDIQVLDGAVIPSSASDHLPLVCQIDQ